MMNEELSRAQTELTAAGCDAALLSSLANVTYVSGYEVPVPIGAGAEMSYGIPLALFEARGDASCLIVPDSSAAAAGKQSRLGELLAFETFDSFRATDSHAAFLARAREALTQAGLKSGAATLAVEFRSMPHALSAMLAEEFPNLRLVDADDPLRAARQIKTEREIVLLHDMEGWKHREIAERLGIPSGTVRSHLHFARKSLRGSLSAAREMETEE